MGRASDLNLKVAGSNPVLFLFTFIFLKEVIKVEKQYCETCIHNDYGFCDWLGKFVDDDDTCTNHIRKQKEVKHEKQNH